MDIHFEGVTYSYGNGDRSGSRSRSGGSRSRSGGSRSRSGKGSAAERERLGLGLSPGLGLDDVTLNIPLGKFTAVLGKSGSGKSTLLQHLNGIMKPTKGHVHVFNTTVSGSSSSRELRELRRQVGLVYQFPEQQCFEHTVEREISFGLRNYGMQEEPLRAAVEQAAIAVGLELELLAANPFQLSSGQLRKVALASVLAMKPDIIALDEPTASLDQTSRQELLQLLSKLVREQGKTVIVVTHKLDEVFPYADDYVLIDNGKILFHGDAHRMLNHAEQLERTGLKLPPAVKLWPLLARRFQAELPRDMRTAEQMIDYIMTLLQRRDKSCASE